MSYQMIHLEIAYRLLDKCIEVERRGDFLMGAIAPDAVHFHKKYEVRLKERSHLWNCGPKWGITIDSGKWKENVLEFWKKHKEDDNRDFIAGYCVHILTEQYKDKENYEISEYQYCSKEVILTFIDECVEMFLDIFK